MIDKCKLCKKIKKNIIGKCLNKKFILFFIMIKAYITYPYFL